MIYKKWTKWGSFPTTGIVRVGILITLLVGTASAEGGFVKTLAQYEGGLTKSAIGLAVILCGLVAWEVLESKKASRSSLDIAKLAAAAAKKKASSAAPASGSLDSTPSRSFAPPPPPPPSTTPPPPPPPPASSAAPPPMENPFATPPSAPSATPGSIPSSPIATDSTVAFNPPDAGSSGGWADLLQRVRSGEPEAASFSGDAPAPSTEGDAVANPFQVGGEAPSFGIAASPSPAAEPSSSSEAWEALLKRTTNPEPSGFDAPPTPGDSGRISLGSSFVAPIEEPVKPAGFQLPATPEPSGPPSPFPMPGTSQTGSPPPPSTSFQLPGAAASNTPPTPFQLPASQAPEPGSASGFKLPESSGSEAPTSSFQFPGGTEAPASPFQVPGAAASSQSESAPSFKLPGGGGGGGGFQLPGAGGANPFGGAEDSSSTLPLSDMFSSSAQSAPSFQLPSLGTQPSGSPFDFTGGGGGHDAGPGRTISLDFSQGTGQVPPPPQPKTEG